MGSFTDSVVEGAALVCLENLSDTIKRGPEIARGELLQKTQQLK
jgi:hypothetical protein